MVLQWALENLNIKLLDINLEVKEAIPAFNTGLNNSINKQLEYCQAKIWKDFLWLKFKNYNNFNFIYILKNYCCYHMINYY